MRNHRSNVGPTPRARLLYIHILTSYYAAKAFAVALIGANFYSRGKIERLQRKKLLRLLRHVQMNVPFYKDCLAGVSPRDLILASVPVTNKAILMDRFSDFISDPTIDEQDVKEFIEKTTPGDYFRSKSVIFTTSGSTGQVGIILNDLQTISIVRMVVVVRTFKSFFSFPKVLNMRPWKKIKWAMILGIGGRQAAYNLSLYTPPFIQFFIDYLYCSVLEPIPVLAQKLNDFQPHLFHGYPTILEALSHEQLSGKMSIKPSIILGTSEPLSGAGRAVIQEAFPEVQISVGYGASECSFLGYQCEEGEIHINEDHCIIEPVDRNNNPTPLGQVSSKLLITNLVNYLQPIIRYELSDSVIVIPDRCKCKSPFQVVRVQGRSDDIFYLYGDNGSIQAHTPLSFLQVFRRVKGIKQFQLIHTEQNRIKVNCVASDSSETETVKASIKVEFQKHFATYGISDSMAIEVEMIRDEIPRDPKTQKFRQIYSLVNAPKK